VTAPAASAAGRSRVYTANSERAPRVGIWASALRRGLDGLYAKAAAAATEAAAPSP